MEEPMDVELIQRARKQDKEAFSELMRLYRMSMVKVASSVLRNEEDVADAIQDTILSCWEKISTLRKPEYFKTWLIRILINHCNAIYNKNKRVRPEAEIEPEGVSVGDYGNVEWQEMLSCLNEKQRIVVELYYVEGFKVREIAALLKVGQSAVKARLQSARKCLESYYNYSAEDRKSS